jgi:hypothetical protein
MGRGAAGSTAAPRSNTRAALETFSTIPSCAIGGDADRRREQSVREIAAEQVKRHRVGARVMIVAGRRFQAAGRFRPRRAARGKRLAEEV